MEEKEKYMTLALELAKKAKGRTNPNPMVGAVVVKNGEIIGQGYHEYYGGLHAERNALMTCTQDPEGSEMYVTLEPCHHYGKTPPCTQIIAEKKVAKIYVGSSDPNPLVAGKGIQYLREQGIEVETGILEKECNEVNEIFFHFISTQTPYVMMKYAMTADGKIATVTGDSKWITGEEARIRVHQTRAEYMGIMVGIGTVLADDPMLNCRIPEGKNPVRIICDSKLRIPLDSQIVRTAKEIPTFIATAVSQPVKEKDLLALGVEVILTPTEDGKVNLPVLMKELGKRKIDSILLEGGGDLNFSALQAGIVQRVQTYIAPKLFGGKTAKVPVSGEGVQKAEDAFPLKFRKMTLVDEDILIEYDVKTKER